MVLARLELQSPENKAKNVRAMRTRRAWQRRRRRSLHAPKMLQVVLLALCNAKIAPYDVGRSGTAFRPATACMLPDDIRL